MDKTSDTDSLEPITRKGSEDGLRAAFYAGVRAGWLVAGNTRMDSLPMDYLDLRYRAFHDHLAGDTWTQERWKVQLQELDRRRSDARREEALARIDHAY